eukprot:Skav210013  [mRNA]  locus=scaffold1212:69600:72319:- [translate_table: standard]
MCMRHGLQVLTHGDMSPEVSLLNGFRDLTLMGVQAFDFNHMNNVLISRDCRKARLIDIDGNSKGSIQYPSEYIQGRGEEDLFKPALDVDLSLVLPVVVQHLICGKGEGNGSLGYRDQGLGGCSTAFPEGWGFVPCEDPKS